MEFVLPAFRLDNSMNDLNLLEINIAIFYSSESLFLSENTKTFVCPKNFNRLL